MILELIRKEFSDISTISGTYLNGMWECFILEDVDRLLESGGEKIPDKTAIPRGRYRIIIDWSDRFQRPMPHILDVPQFKGIRFHPGNVDVDTKGCLLPGTSRGIDRVYESAIAFNALFHKLWDAFIAHEEIWIEVK